jgi:hypothetical protein
LRPPHDKVALGFLSIAVVLTLVSGIDYFVSALRGRATKAWT